MVDKFISKKSTVRLKTPNPLFEKWLLEWHLMSGNEETIFSKALKSLKKYPLVLNSGLECIILEHFDEQLCLKLHKKLDEHKKFNKEKNQETEFSKNSVTPDDTDINSKMTIKSKQTNKVLGTATNCQLKSPKRKNKPYVPAKRSAAYGLLSALVLTETESGYPGFMLKEELQKKAQVHCDVSLKKTAPGSYYTGWSSMSHLIAKELVTRTGTPAKFSLTEKGRKLALSLIQESTEQNYSQIPLGNNLICNPTPVPSFLPSNLTVPAKRKGKKKQELPGSSTSEEPSSQSQEFETEEMIFLPSAFDIFLLVDTAETAGAAKREEDKAILALTNFGVKFEVRHLKVGDYIWVARDVIGREIVLPYIVERKRLDDLGASIKDGRFHEQKFRIKQCGLQRKIYLVEESGFDRNGLPLESIQQAISNTMICDGFTVKWTNDLLDSMQYLTRMTQILIQTFQNKTLFSCKKVDLPDSVDFQDDIISLLSFQDFSFNMGKIKSLTPREIFAKMLVQLHGLSGDKAWVITEHYPTPKLLTEGFLFGEAESIITNLNFGLFKRRIGPQIASTLKSFYTINQFPG